MNLETIYRGKKVFVTGHTGFKGSWLISWLYQLGAEVKGYALLPENEFDLFYAIKGHTLCESVIADVRDKARLSKEILTFQPDFIFHLAAQPLVRLSYEQPSETFNTNAQGTAHLLDALRFLNKSCVVVCITTDKVYHNLEIDYSYKEMDRLGGHDPYSASKACAELIIESYRNSFFDPVKYRDHRKTISVARAGNVIGGGDWSRDRIIPDIIRALQNDKPVIVRNPFSIRPWQHVLEPLHGYLVLGAHQIEDPEKFADAFNFGPYEEDALKVEDLVKTAIEHWGKGEYSLTNQSSLMHEAGLLKLDISKSLEKLNWKPKLTAKQAIKQTIEWYKHYTEDSHSALPLIMQAVKIFVAKR